MAGDSYRFGPFLVDRARYRVLRDGHPLVLTPKLLDLLLYLLERPAVLVTKEALLDALWPDANVTDNALTQAVSELRQALGDNPGAPQYIKTVARRGYRFIGDVAVSASGTTEPVTRASKTTAAAVDTLKTIVVQDFHNVTRDAEYEWLSAGVAETVTGDLRALGHFRVVDRWRVTEAMRGTDGSLEQLASAVQAELAVVGSFQRSGERLRITARVVDVAGGEALVDAKADGALTDIFDLQDSIVASFARDLRVPHALKNAAGTASKDTHRLDAYRAFTEGWVRLESFDVRDLPQAIADFERAVSLDHRYAVAYAGLANAELASYEATRFEIEPAVHLLERAIAHARQAAALDDTLAEAHGALSLALGSAFRMPEAAASAQRAVALEPSSWRHRFRLCRASWGESRLAAGRRTLSLYPEFALSYFQMAMLQIARRQLSEAEALLRLGASVQDQQIGRGERLPGRGLHWLLGMTRLAEGDQRDALCEFERELAVSNLHHMHGREFAVRSHVARGLTQLALGAIEDAAASCRRALDLYAAHPEAHLALGIALRRLGSTDASATEISTAERALPVLARTRPFDGAILLASIRVVQDQKDAAVGALESLPDTAPAGAAWSLPVDPFLAPLHGHKGFESTLHRLSVLAR